jgi:predicted RNase H-like nuclease
MVDAPLFVPNASQMRECDRETHRRYGRFQAGAYPANRTNLSRYYGDRPRGEALRERLMRYGFPAAACSLPPPAVATRLVFECYPHPAHIVLFGLRLTLKYKKKRQTWDQARSEFRRYLRLMRGLEDPRLDLRQDLLRELDPGDDVGKRYKEKEDRLDAIFGAYLSALVPTGWVEMIGQPEDGGMVVPLPRLARLVYLHHQR